MEPKSYLRWSANGWVVSIEKGPQRIILTLDEFLALEAVTYAQELAKEAMVTEALDRHPLARKRLQQLRGVPGEASRPSSFDEGPPAA